MSDEDFIVIHFRNLTDTGEDVFKPHFKIQNMSSVSLSYLLKRIFDRWTTLGLTFETENEEVINIYQYGEFIGEVHIDGYGGQVGYHEFKIKSMSSQSVRVQQLLVQGFKDLFNMI